MFHPPSWTQKARAVNDGDLASLMANQSGSDSWLNGRSELQSEILLLTCLYQKGHTYGLIGDGRVQFQGCPGAVGSPRSAIVIRIKETRHVALPSWPQLPGPTFCTAMQLTKVNPQLTLLHDTVSIMLSSTFGENEPVGWWSWERIGNDRES